MINPLNHHYAMENPASIYDEEALTALELAGRTTAKVNETVNAFNDLETETNKHLENQDKTIETRLGAQDTAIKKMNDVTMPAKVTAEVQRKIDSGEFDSAINVYAGDLESRVDNLLGKVVEGSTTGDAELIDARLDHTGKTHSNVGEAVRSVTGMLSDATLATFNNGVGFIPVTERGSGFYQISNTTTGAFWKSNSENYHFCRTPLIPCNPGEKYLYYGKTATNVPSAFFYEGNVYSGKYEVSATSTDYFTSYTSYGKGKYFGWAEITIPEGCTHVIFQSIAQQSQYSGDPVLECTLMNETLESRVKDLELSKESNHHRYVDHGYQKNDFVYLANFYKGNPGEHNGTITGAISCKAGDVFKWTGVSKGTIPCAFFFRGEKYLSNYIAPGELSNIQTLDITIPDECDRVIFQSFAIKPNEAVLEVKNPDTLTLVQLNEEIKSKTTSGNILYGKKYVACGDSFTEGIACDLFTDGPFAGKHKAYPYLIGDRNGMDVVNLAVGGMTMCNVDGTRSNAFSNEKYKNIPLDADYITLKFGINDSNYSSPIGTSTDTDTTTFYGAWNTVMEYILTNMPYAKVGIIITNGANAELAEATRVIARRWGIPFLDEDAGEQVPLLHRNHRDGICAKANEIRRNAFIVSESDTHPNGKAHEYESTFVEHFMRSL